MEQFPSVEQWKAILPACVRFIEAMRDCPVESFAIGEFPSPDSAVTHCFAWYQALTSANSLDRLLNPNRVPLSEFFRGGMLLGSAQGWPIDLIIRFHKLRQAFYTIIRHLDWPEVCTDKVIVIAPGCTGTETIVNSENRPERSFWTGRPDELLAEFRQAVIELYQRLAALLETENSAESAKQDQTDCLETTNNGKGKDIDSQILKTLETNPECTNWTQREWADKLGCVPSTINESKAFEKVREMQAHKRAERAIRDKNYQPDRRRLNNRRRSGN